MEPSQLIIKGSEIQDHQLIANGRSIKLVNQNLWQIPSPLTTQYASRVRKLDLSYNCLQTLSGIEYFNCLEELVLDNNLLDDSIRFFYNPFMKCLSINKNKLTDLERFLNEITLKLPSLTYLSMLGNPACPDQLSSSEHDDKDYSRYRSYVIHRMPQLKFLDSTQIRRTERTDAQQRGHYYRLIRLNSDSVVETNKLRSHLFTLREQNDNNDDDGRQNNPLPFTQDNGQPKGGFGKLKHRYTGKHSEGNRFIRNHEL
ncbi:leucine-rich repeat-containing protein [Dermatophagoides farinae]|uniref:Leucine-rich repeat-containing protein n=1 Tax=Dermatophagoides farinae TaxID=6954 RepID=A0A9D4SD80_DERFA|nr:leucine-rich repeat-containing protein [Dermatophagoides farinae]